jgi:hypothetical protein
MTTPVVITRTGKQVDSIPTANPAIMFVACPVSDAFAIDLTGLNL